MRQKPLIGRLSGLAGLAALVSVAFGSVGARATGLVGARAEATASVPHSPSPMAHASAARLDNGPDTARLSFDLSGAVSPTVSLLADPYRVLVDLPQLDFAAESEAETKAKDTKAKDTKAKAAHDKRHGLVGSFRFGLLAPGRSRIILDLSGPARATAAVRKVGSETRLVIDLTRTDRAGFAAAAARSQAAAIAPAPTPAVLPAPGKVTIVLDPGHGGPDTGANVGGVIEKEVALAFATSLASKLEATGGFNVVMTRSSDVFIPLSERVHIARNANAALMVSIHADTLPETADVSGATVYTVSDKASDAYAAKVAAKENDADSTVGLDGQADTADVNDILFDLTRQETRAYSHVFARTLVNYWKVAGRLNKNPSRAAGFVVLKAPDVPSVLLELGYLSSPTDAAQLTSAEWRDKATSRMAEAVEAYFADRNGPAKAAAGVPMPLPSQQATADLGGLRR